MILSTFISRIGKEHAEHATLANFRSISSNCFDMRMVLILVAIRHVNNGSFDSLIRLKKEINVNEL